jgi:predicted MFS family arabinose efflux permease
MSAIAPATDPPWGTVTVLALSAFASSGMTRTLDPLLPRLAKVYDIPVGHAAWAITAFGVVYGLLQAFYGPVGDRHGKLRVIAIAALVSVFACIGCALASGSFAGLVLARALAGACCAASLPLGTAWIGDAVPYAQRQGVLARFMMGQMTGMASGQMLGGFAAEHSWWQWPFLLFAAVFAVSGLLLLRRIAKTEAEPASSAPALGAAGALLEVLRRPWARVVLMTVLLEGFCYIGAFTYIATHLHRVGGLSLNHAGLILICFSGGGLLFALLSPRYGTRLDEPARVAIGSTLAALSLAALATLTEPLPATIAIFLSGLGFYLLHNALQLNATQMAPDRRGAAVALFTTCFFVGQAMGVASFGLIADQWGTAVVLLLGAASLLPLGLGFALQLRRREDSEPLPA